MCAGCVRELYIGDVAAVHHLYFTRPEHAVRGHEINIRATLRGVDYTGVDNGFAGDRR